MRDKKGFTLVELLAVIVILAVVMLIGGTVVLPMMQKAQKSTVGTEGASLKKSAENAFSAELMKGVSATFKSTDKVCLSMSYLCANGYFDKGCQDASGVASDKYYGSVLVDGSSYKMWITNGTYSYWGWDAATIVNPDKAINYSDGENAVISHCGCTDLNPLISNIDVFK